MSTSESVGTARDRELALTSARLARTRFEHSEPILSVKSMAASMAYDQHGLGFRNARGPGEWFTSVKCAGASIYVCQGGPGTWICVGVEDVAALFSEHQASGARIRCAPVSHSRAYEMQVEDPDGHVLRFGSEPRTDLPFARQAC